MGNQDYSQQSFQEQPYQEQPYPGQPLQEQYFPQPGQRKNEPVPGPPPLQGEPEKPAKKRSALAGFFAFVILLFLFIVAVGVFVLMSVFVHFKTPLGFYAAISIVSLCAGGLIGLIAKELIRTDKGYLWACSLISCIAAGLVSTVVSIQLYLTRQLAELVQAVGEADIAPVALLSLFAPASDPLTTALLILVFFNIPVLIMFFKMKQKKIWHLVIYFLPILIFMIIFYLLPDFILSRFSEISGFF